MVEWISICVRRESVECYSGHQNRKLAEKILDLCGGQHWQSKYQPLTTGYILASISPDANRTVVTVEGYLVQNILP